jgi:acetyl-CoA synthetase
VLWGEEAFGLPIHDNWWQTETGGIMIANYLSMPIKPGSMGRPLPGIEAGIVRRLPEGGVEAVTEADVQGELALRSGWPSMFRAYLGEEERYRKCFADGWYLTGDLARRDADGYFWFVGRGDDVIKSSGHLIGPFEVESSLMEHPAVAEAGVIGKPIRWRMVVKARRIAACSRRVPGFSANCSLSCASVWGRQWRPRRSTSSPTCPRPGAGRSCAAC